MFRENTEDLYAGVDFNPVPPELAETLSNKEGKVQTYDMGGSSSTLDIAKAIAAKL